MSNKNLKKLIYNNNKRMECWKFRKLSLDQLIR